MQHKKDKQRSNAVRYTTTAVAILLMCALCFTFLIFATDTIINVDTDEANRADNLFGRISVSTVIETVEEDESYGDGSNNDEILDGNPGSQVTPPMQSHEWYTDIASSGVKFSTNVIGDFTLESGETFEIYDGIPFNPSTESQICYFNLSNARRDTEAWWGSGAVTKAGWHRMGSSARQAVYYTSVGSPIGDSDGDVKCFSVNLAPSFVSPTYCDGFKEGYRWISESTVDVSLYGRAGGVYAPHPVVLQVEMPNGSIGYIPVEPWAKAHTWPGGVYQTHVSLGNGTASGNTSTTFTVDTGDWRSGGFQSCPHTTTRATAWADYNTWNYMNDDGNPVSQYLQLSVEPANCTGNDTTMLNAYKVVGAILWR